MTARTHDLAAITLLSVAFLSRPIQTLTLSTAIVAVVANLIGGITPDIDQPTAPFWRNLPILKFFGRYFDNLVGGHRFLTHSILGLALFGFLAHWLLVFIHPIMPGVDIGLVWWAFMLGMVSHLIMDSFTKEGVPWFLPMPFKIGFPPVRKLRVTTGKKFESFIVFPVLLGFDALLFAANYQQILTIMHRYVV